jgi:hypothetical protein
MKFTLLISTLVTVVAARNCTPGLYYCTSTLLRIGTIVFIFPPPSSLFQVFQRALMNTNDMLLGNYAQQVGNHNANFLFYCTGGSNGEIQPVKQCGVCTDGGNGKNDFCQ